MDKTFYLKSQSREYSAHTTLAGMNRDNCVEELTITVSDEHSSGEATITWSTIGGDVVPTFKVIDDGWKAILSDTTLISLLQRLDDTNISPESMVKELQAIGYKNTSEKPEGRRHPAGSFANTHWSYDYFRSILALILGVDESALTDMTARLVENAVKARFESQLRHYGDNLLQELIAGSLREQLRINKGDIIVPKYQSHTKVFVADGDEMLQGEVMSYSTDGMIYVSIGDGDDQFGAFSPEQVFDNESEARQKMTGGKA